MAMQMQHGNSSGRRNMVLYELSLLSTWQELAALAPQSKQSEQREHIENSDPGPPSSQSPSEANEPQLLSH